MIVFGRIIFPLRNFVTQSIAYRLKVQTRHKSANLAQPADDFGEPVTEEPQNGWDRTRSPLSCVTIGHNPLPPNCIAMAAALALPPIPNARCALARVLFIVLALVLGSTAPAEAKRVALVISNSRYLHATALKNPASDARLIAGALRQAGFAVDARTDLGKAQAETALRDFGRKAENADVALIYYAGHGIEAGGENYLIPVDARLERDRDLDIEATKLETALRVSEGARMRIVILDACRNNPFMASMQRTVRSRAVGRGLAAIEPEGETLVVYAAKAGATAADGEGANSPFAEALAGRLVQPGLEIGLMFRAVRDDVLKRTARVQEPFTYGSLSGNAFYFIAPTKAGAVPVVATAAPAPTVSEEALFWQGALSAGSEVGFRDYLTRYPKGRYAGLARENISRLKTPAVAAPAAGAQTAGRGNRYDNGVFPNMSRAFTSAGGPVMPAGDPDAAIRAFDFVPDQTLRTRIRDKTLNGVFGKPGSDMRKLTERSFPMADPFSKLSRLFATYGLSENNAVDGALLTFENMRRNMTANWKAPTVQQMTMARRQIAGAMARDPVFRTLTQAELQSFSDEWMFLAAINIHNEEQFAKTGGFDRETFRENIEAAYERMVGFSIAALRLTDQGYVK
jgi:Caspase domain